MAIEKKVALVTGGSRGIGRAVCLRLARKGVTIGINFVANPSAAEETLAQVEAVGGTGFLAQFDVADSEGVQKAVKKIIDEHESITILVNNAGITRDALMARMKESDWDAVFNTNLKGAFLCSKAVMKSMMKKRWGRIVNIGSVIGFLGNGGQVNYGAAKAGLAGLTKSMARELAGRNITVNCVAPGYIITDMTDSLAEDIQQEILRQIPLKRLGTPEDVAAAVAFLTTDDSSYLTGQTLHVNGGMYMSN
ncbi:MAG: beta-ketoacyl-ACP reductase [Desulfobulbus propionicus]|nr:MAG: beta-ketoacyl-ACP reductase [Desulfobulbus propionicus]